MDHAGREGDDRIQREGRVGKCAFDVPPGSALVRAPPVPTRAEASACGVGWRRSSSSSIARSFAFVWWPDVHFDADQAVTGLMASHLIEGRAFPVFQYAQEYVLVVESWLAAPVMAIWPGSIAALRSVPVAINVATAVLLFLTVRVAPATEKKSALLQPVSASRARLSAASLPIAFLATLPVALPGPMTSADLTDALGMNIEPLLFAVLLWRWRTWPVGLGIAAAVAMKNREFTIYALAALVTLDVIRYAIDRIPALARWRESPAESRIEPPADPSVGDLPSRRGSTAAVDWPRFWRGRAVAAVCFAIAWAAIGAVKQYSTPFGPGTAFGILADSRDNTAVAASAMCIVPAKMPGDLWAVASKMLPLQLGAGDERLQTARLYAHAIGNYSWLWPPLAIVLIGRDRARTPSRVSPRPVGGDVFRRLSRADRRASRARLRADALRQRLRVHAALHAARAARARRRHHPRARTGIASSHPRDRHRHRDRMGQRVRVRSCEVDS